MRKKKLIVKKITEKNVYLSPSSLQKKIYLSLGFCIVFVLSLYFAFSSQEAKSTFHASGHQISLKALAQNSVASVSALPTQPSAALTPTASPTPALNPTATQPKIANDYCLYVPVLMYHHIEPYGLATQEGHQSLTVDNGWFDHQMQYLTIRGYTSITAQQLVNAVISRQAVPAKSIVITIDDGYSDLYTYAYPILQKYHITANLMIPTGLINNNGYMTWDQLKQMEASGVVQIYNHTWSHSPLGADNSTKILFEMNTSQQQLKQYAGIAPTTMAYPYGSFSPLAISILRQLGFSAAFSTIPGQNNCLSNIMTLPRMRIGNTQLITYGL